MNRCLKNSKSIFKRALCSDKLWNYNNYKEGKLDIGTQYGHLLCHSVSDITVSLRLTVRNWSCTNSKQVLHLTSFCLTMGVMENCSSLLLQIRASPFFATHRILFSSDGKLFSKTEMHLKQYWWKQDTIITA